MRATLLPAAQVERGVWDLNCPLWLLHRPGAPILSAKLWMRGGSAGDPGDQRGAAQLLAGLLSRGCGPYSGYALADLVEGCGAGLRCEAAEDATLISLKCASDDAPVLLPLLLQMVCSPWLVDDQIALERQLNLQTLQRQREDPFQLAHDQLREQHYGQGPYGHDPMGVEAELRRSPMSLTAALEPLPTADVARAPVSEPGRATDPAVTAAARLSPEPTRRPEVARRPSPTPSRRAAPEPTVAPTPAATASPSASAASNRVEPDRRISVDDDDQVPVVGGVPTVE
jgi:hypothetical protein